MRSYRKSGGSAAGMRWSDVGPWTREMLHSRPPVRWRADRQDCSPMCNLLNPGSVQPPTALYRRPRFSLAKAGRAGSSRGETSVEMQKTNPRAYHLPYLPLQSVGPGCNEFSLAVFSCEDVRVIGHRCKNTLLCEHYALSSKRFLKRDDERIARNLLGWEVRTAMDEDHPA